MKTSQTNHDSTKHKEIIISSILNRKSIREYIPQKMVNKKDIYTLIRTGMAAPSAGDRQPWAFIAITERELLDKLANILPEAKFLNSAGGAIVVCGDMTKTLEGPGGDFWIQDCSAATQNILLAAEAMELGAVWMGVYPNHFVGKENVIKLNRILNLPGTIVILNVIAIGYPQTREEAVDKYDETKIYPNKWSARS